MKTKKQDSDYGIDEDAFEIDEDQLDKEWIRQPSLMFKMSRRVADARKSLEISRTELKLIDAELDAKIRADPDQYGLAKATEKSVEACILTQDEHIDAQNVVHSRKHKLDVLEAAVDALHAKKRGLESLVQLFAMSYFGKPKAANEAIEEEMEEKVKKDVYGRAVKKRRDR